MLVICSFIRNIKLVFIVIPTRQLAGRDLFVTPD